MTLLVVLAGVGQQQQTPIQDLNLLVGKQVMVQRAALRRSLASARCCSIISSPVDWIIDAWS
jgi:hypothetical protein